MIRVLRRHAWFICVTALGCGILGSLCVGAYAVPPGAAMRILLRLAWSAGLPDQGQSDNVDQIVIQTIRLPRILLAASSGAGLGLTGATMQGMFRNPLVSPDLLGVSAGAASGGALALLLGLSAVAVTAFSFAGGTCALVASIMMAKLGHQGTSDLVLAGVIVTALFGALLTLMQFVADPAFALPRIVHWLMGSFSGATVQSVSIVGTIVGISGAFLLAMRWRINLLSLGDLDAMTLGVSVKRLRIGLILLIGLIVAAQVSVSGIVGWIGLIVPHMARMLVGPDHRRLLPASAMLGGAFMLLMDDIARTATDQELPIGVLTAVVGAPVFAIVFWKRRSTGWMAGE